MTKLTDLETEEKGIVRGATPEEELKAKQLSDRAHAEATLQSNYKFASEKNWARTTRPGGEPLRSVV